MTDDVLLFLGLMRRAGKLSHGEDGTRQAVRSGKATLLLLASDASGNTTKKAAALADSRKLPLIRLDTDKATLSAALGVAGGAIYAVCDSGFSKALLQKLQKDVEV